MQLVLASTSPRRRELLERVGLRFAVEPSGIDERATAAPSPSQLVEQLAVQKAASVAERHRATGSNALIIGSDTVVSLDGEVLGKPRDAAEAVQMLRRLSGRWHEVHTGIALVPSWTLKAVSDVCRTRVRFAELSETEIEAYVASGEPMDKAGAYGIQALGALLVAEIEGDYFTVMGLPLRRLYELLQTFGVTVWTTAGEPAP